MNIVNDNQERLFSFSTSMHWLLGLGLTFSVATQLRINGVGPGELMLVAWCCFVVMAGIRRRKIYLRRVLVPFQIFWIIGMLSLLAGFVAANLLGLVVEDPYRDLFAYIFITVLVLTFTISTSHKDATRVIGIYVTVSMLCLVGLFLLAMFGETFGSLELWYGFRFRGWAENPNQLSLQLCTFPFWGMLFYLNSFTRVPRVFAVVGIVLSLILGLTTFSDALLLAWVAGVATMLVSGYIFRVRDGRRSARSWVALTVGGPVVVATLALVIATQYSDEVIRELEVGYDNAGQGPVRLALWRHGAKAILVSPVVGLGPGAHSGLVSPHQGKEAHNTLIDWGASTGLMGLLVFLVLYGWLVRTAWHQRNSTLLGLLITLLVLFQFHYVLRHPVFWFQIMIAAVLMENQKKREFPIE